MSVYYQCLGPPSTSPQKKRQTVKSSVCNLGLERRHDDEIDLVLVTLPLLPPDMLNSIQNKTYMFSLRGRAKPPSQYFQPKQVRSSPTSSLGGYFKDERSLGGRGVGQMRSVLVTMTS